jgi:hypothetical protein
MKTYGVLDARVWAHVSLVSALDGEWSDLRLYYINSWERASLTHSTGGWMGSRACLDDIEK